MVKVGLEHRGDADEMRACASRRSDARSSKRIAPCAGASASTARLSSPTARACSRTATRARSRPAASARRSPRCTSRSSQGNASRSTPTRPARCLQGSRLTAWELQRAGIPVTVLVDGAAASLLRDGEVDLCIVGADRIAANGDVANKVGTYPLAIAACRHSVPFYVAAPTSTFDPATPRGDEILIEQRSAEELRRVLGAQTAPANVAGLQPGVRRHAGGADHGDHQRPRDPPAAVRFLGARGVKHVLADRCRHDRRRRASMIGEDGQGRRPRLSRGPAVFPGGRVRSSTTRTRSSSA